jgi:L-ascorbate metabolism protein UlaG (beta-lactamase superfamily)
MRITKFGHSCVRLEHGTATVVVDPGSFTERAAVEGATAVLITHVHGDHYDADHLRAADAPIWTIEEVAAEIRSEAPDLAERLTVVSPGEQFDAGIDVRAVGKLHAVIHPEMQRFHNSGYLFDVDGRTLYHPGDSLIVPDAVVDLLMLPVSAPWLKTSEAVDFARDVGAAHNLAIHDRIFSEIGLSVVDRHMDTFLSPREQAYVRVAAGSDVDVPQR